MARKQNGTKWFDNSPDAYARTVLPWQTRQGRRNREFASFPNLLGLNTALDDLHKKDGESPFLRNFRYMGEKQTSQRTQETSRNGAKFLQSIGDERSYPATTEAQTFLEVNEGRAIEFDATFLDKLVGGMLYIQNVDGAKGVLRVILKDSPKSEGICDAVINLTTVSRTRYDRREFRFIQALTAKNNGGGTATIRLEIFDDVDPDTSNDAQPILGRKIRILATGDGSHRYANYELPNTDQALREQPYTFLPSPGIPLFGKITNGLTVMKKGIKVFQNGDEFLVFPVRLRNRTIQIWRHNLRTNEMNQCNAAVDNRAKAVRFDQGPGFIYYVDGYSHLQRIRQSTWTSEIAIPVAGDIDAPGVDPQSLRAKQGASLILNLRNRLYLSGFKDDPNWVQFSLINAFGAQFDQFNEGFYSPDRSPEASAGSPVVGLNKLENNLVVWRPDGNSVFSAPTGLEFGKAQQLDTFAANLGVASQDDVAEGNGNLWFYNRSEGFRRYAGADTSFQSFAIDNELRRIKQGSDTFMIAHGNKVRFYFDREDRGHADHALVYHTILAGQSPWYMDDNAPLSWAVADQDSDTIYAMHADYPAVYIVDEPNQLTDFDSMIVAQYHTQYKAPGSTAGYSIIRRVQVKVIASATNSWFIGVDFDHRDKPAVWRKFVRGMEDGAENIDAIFPDTADAGTNTINLFMRAKCRDFNVRVLVYCYRSQAELQYIQAEYGGKEPL